MVWYGSMVWPPDKCQEMRCLRNPACAGKCRPGKDPDGHEYEDAVIESRLKGHIHLCRGTMPYLPPDKPYKYLGVLLTLILNWSH